MIICPNPNCGYRGEGKKVGGNNGCLILILLCFGILPGILYLLFCPRKGVVCPKCGVRIYWSVSWIFLQCGLDLTELIQNVFFVYGKCAGEFGTETSWRSFPFRKHLKKYSECFSPDDDLKEFLERAKPILFWGFILRFFMELAADSE